METEGIVSHLSKPKIILIDIETSPIVGYTWGTYDQTVLKVIEPSKIISVAWKELHSKTTYVKCLSDYTGYKKGIIDDKRLIQEVWKILDDADIAIAHNGDSFDFKRLNARFVWHGLTAPSAYQTIDTLKVAKKHFKFDGNSLNSLGQYFNLGSKAATGGFSLWTECISGDKSAWNKMKAYNKQDVDLLEKVYLVLRPYQANHPNVTLISGGCDGETCPSCQSTSVMKRGLAYTRTGSKQRYQCKDCGSWSSGGFVKNTLKSLLVKDDE